MAENYNGIQPGQANNQDNYERKNSLDDQYDNGNNNNNYQNNNDMQGLAANDDFDNGFEEVAEQNDNAGLYEDNAAGGGLGAMMGLDDGMGGNDDLTQMEMDMMNDGGQKIPIRMFVDMDEDDDNSYNIQINEFFKRDDPALQFYVDLQIGDHYNCKEMIVEAIDLFNQRLSLPEINAKYRLADDVTQIEDNYVLYIAKKKGKPKDDFPGLSLNSSVKKLTYERFCLCCNTSAFITEGGSASVNIPATAVVEQQNTTRSSEGVSTAKQSIQTTRPQIQSHMGSNQDSLATGPNGNVIQTGPGTSIIKADQQKLDNAQQAKDGCCCTTF